MAEEQDVDTLKRRSRRRLIGAIALVLLAVIVLPMVFDSEPRGSGTPVQIRIPGEGEGGFSPKGPFPASVVETPRIAQTDGAGSAQPPLPAEGVEKTVGQTAEAPPAKSVPAPAVAAPEPKRKAEDSPAAAPSSTRTSSERLAGGGRFVVPVAAFASPEKLKELLASLRGAKVTYYTEPIATAKGQVTRVRAGPFETREEAEAVRERLLGLGLKPGAAIAKAE